MGIKDSMKNVSTALRLDSHHGIERFGVFVAAIAVSFVLLFGSAAVSSVTNQQADLDSTTLYTPTFTTSRTQVSGEVNGVYVNTDRTRALLLMQFKSTSVMSANAEKYKAYLTGATSDLKDQPLKSAVTGEIVVFGSTGYMGMVIDSDRPFEQQILNLTMRSNSELVYKPADARKLREDLAGQKTFAEFDQWRLYFNPGASGATETAALDGDTFDAGAVYADLVVAPQEEEVRADLDEQLEQMKVDQARIAEYTAEGRRVSVDGVQMQLPELPAPIAGDQVTGDVAKDDTPSTLELDAEWVSSRGFNFDWRDGSVEEGYIRHIVPEGDSYVTYLADKAAAGKSAEESNVRSSQLEWPLTNGRLLTDYGTSDKAMQPLFEIRNDLSQAMDDYFKHKSTYQNETLAKLVELEVDLETVRASSSSRTDAEALFTY
ncbi:MULTISPECIES: hypothetical protein [unclassified Microbacterium]|uniref:hypothetical protein n=1 Tax=unclassified Microbacterium TaxID=2609290 RepID=UPI00288316F0|nr:MULTISPECIES: hypothetical protein [unclassified Microbacterium]